MTRALANPHAAISIGSTTHSYDNNGNLTTDSLWNQTWNYRNNLTLSANVLGFTANCSQTAL